MKRVLICLFVAAMHFLCADTQAQEEIPIGGGGGVTEPIPHSCCLFLFELKDPTGSCYKTGATCSATIPNFPYALCNNFVVGEVLTVVVDTCWDEDNKACVPGGASQPIVLKLGVLSCPGTPNQDGDCVCTWTVGTQTHTHVATRCGGDLCSPAAFDEWLHWMWLQSQMNP